MSAQETADWLQHLYTHTDTGWLTLFAINRQTGERHTRWHPIHHHQQAATDAHQLADQCCVWFGVAPRQQQLTNGKRGGHTDCLQIPALWVDIDIQSPAHTATNLPPNRDAAHQLLNTFPLPPTATIDTGHGLQAWWQLTEPQPNNPETQQLLADWGATWANLANQHHYHIDNVFDIARIMRLPGTLNHKTTPTPVTILHTNWQHTYTPDDLTDHLTTAPTPTTSQRHLAAVPYIGPERPGDAYNAVTDPATILETAGCHYNHTDTDGARHYRAPHRTQRGDTTGATIYPDGHTTIWSETFAQQHGLETRRPYDPFGLYTQIHHHGDWTAATRTLRQQGYGTDQPTNSSIEFTEPPQPLDTQERHGPPFPLHTLPPWIANQIKQAAHLYQVPPDLPATLALGALSTIHAGHTKVHVTGTKWNEHVNLYLVSALLPGSGKSPVFKAMTRALTEIETQSIKHARTASIEYEQKRRLTEQRLKAAETIAVKANKEDARIAETEMLELAISLDNQQKPPTGYLISEDITPEALVEELAANAGRMAILSSEGGIFDMMAGQYVDKGKATNLAVYLQGWSADSIHRKRTKGDRADIPEAILTICVTTQPGVVQALGANTELVTRGLPVRFMYSMPPSLVGYRNRRRVLETGDDNIETLYHQTLLQIGLDALHQPDIQTLQLEPDAVDHFLEYDQQLEDRQRPGGDLRHRAEWIAKLRASILRCAGLLHIAHQHHSPHISLDTIKDAITIGHYWLEHANVVEQLWTEDRTASAAHGILKWAIEHDVYEFSLRDVMSAKRGKFSTADEIVTPLQQLVDKKWIKPLQDGPVELTGRGVPSQRFQLRKDAAEWLKAATQPAQPAQPDPVARVARIARKSEIQKHPPTQPTSPSTPKNPTQPAQPAQLEATGTDHTTPPVDNSRPITPNTPLI